MSQQCILECNTNECDICNRINKQLLTKNLIGKGATGRVYTMTFGKETVAVKITYTLNLELEYMYMRQVYDTICSRHVIRPFALVQCKYRQPVPSLDSYLMMEQVDGTLNCKDVECNWDVITFQIIYTLAQMWDTLKMVHNDLHLDNIFYSKQNVPTQKVWKYTYKRKTFYIPRTPFIVKIGDFGLANSESNRNPEDYHDVIPRYPLAPYDVATFIYQDEIPKGGVKNKLMTYLFGSTRVKKFYQDHGRPNFDGSTPLDLDTTPGDVLLKSKAFDKFLKKPKGTTFNMC